MSPVRSSVFSTVFFRRSAALLAAVSCTALAQAVDLGATGADGPLIITTNTVLPVPESGVIHATQIDIAAGATLSFTPNAKNTGIILTATEEVVINGTITVDGAPGVQGAGGAGGIGGTAGGAPATFGHFSIYGAVTGPGNYSCMNMAPEQCTAIAGSRGGTGSYNIASAPTPGCTLGNGGGGGGGHLYIASNKSITGTGTVSAQGGAGGALKTSCNGTTSGSSVAEDGWGGTVTLMAPRIAGGSMTARLGRSGVLYLRALELVGSPPVLQGLSAGIGFAETLISWRPAPAMTVLITAINGQPVSPTASATVTVGAGLTNVTVQVDGCDRGVLRVAAGRRNSANSWSQWGGEVSVSNPTASQTVELIELPNPPSGQTYVVAPFASCAG